MVFELTFELFQGFSLLIFHYISMIIVISSIVVDKSTAKYNIFEESWLSEIRWRYQLPLLVPKELRKRGFDSSIHLVHCIQPRNFHFCTKETSLESNKQRIKRHPQSLPIFLHLRICCSPIPISTLIRKCSNTLTLNAYNYWDFQNLFKNKIL